MAAMSDDPTGEQPVLLSTAPAQRADWRLAIPVVLALFAIFLVTVPFAQIQFPYVWGFIPIYQTALVITDLLTAVQGSWAGAVEPASPDDWRVWFDRYRAALLPIAQIAAEERAEALAIGTELAKTTQRPEWQDIIAAVRPVFAGLLTYAAHNVEEADAVPFWPQLDAIGVTLYPKLGEGLDRDGRRTAMRVAADWLDALSKREGKPVLVAEIGLRSARGATLKPWESAEERVAEPDAELQAAVLADWLEILDRPSIEGVLVWRWFTDPSAGGPADTDFTVQGKPAQRMFCERAKSCAN
jgi:hypothetical protein